jgi:glucose-6-phosphate isomerase
MTDPNQASVGGGFVVTGAQRVAGAAEAVKQALADDAPARLAAKDATLWGAAAEAEAAIRLGWTDLPETSRDLLGRLAALRAELAAEGLDHVVLAGMGGSSLAPEVIARTLGVELVVLDTTDPHQVRAALADRLDRTVVVVSSKSGGTVETDSHRRAYHQAFLDSGLSTEDAGRRFVVVTDPGSPLEATAAEFGARAVFLADPNVGGRYSALTAFGLVPSALAGVDVASLLDEAAALAGTLAGENPALALGAALGAAANAGRDKLVLAEDGSGIVGLGDWAEQLIAESTGKDGKGILPVVVESATAPGTRGPDVVVATAGGAVREVPPPTGSAPDLSVNGALGAHFLGWEYATAVAGRIIGINPFDQPNVAESKENTARILASGPPHTTAAFTDGAIEVYGDAGLLGGARNVADALTALLEGVDERGYLAVLAFLDRVGDAPAAELRALLAERTTRPVTFGWGPRYLHSTGQYHKGGPAVGSFLQVTGAVVDDLPVPGRPYTFGALQAAQAAGDLEALAGRGRPTLRLHLTDRGAGVRQLLAAFR